VRRLLLFGLVTGMVMVPRPARAMHISEGILPLGHALAWTLIGGVFLAFALRSLRRKAAEDPMFKPFIGMVGAGVFLVSAMPIPVPFAGTVSHPAGTGIAAILIGPAATVVVTSVTLLLHALFLAHGGLSTLGADVFAMGVLGGYTGYGVYRLGRCWNLGQGTSAFLAGLLGDWMTYLGTSFILAMALRGGEHGPGSLFVTLVVAFVPTQAPLGVLEGVVAVAIVGFLLRRRPGMVRRLTRIVPVVLMGVLLAAGPARGQDTAREAWPGVDVVVVEEKAREHGRRPGEPWIPLEGDLLLLACLLAGGVSGFGLGYYYHRFFVCDGTKLDAESLPPENG